MLIKKLILERKWIISSKEHGTGMLYKFFLMVESLLFIGAGAEAGEKNTRSRSKTDRLRNTGSDLGYLLSKNEYFIILNLQKKLQLLSLKVTELTEVTFQ